MLALPPKTKDSKSASLNSLNENIASITEVVSKK
jgi:hypothetical protein